MKMTVSYEWLCDLVPHLDKHSPEDIGLALTAIGAETEDINLLSYGKSAELAQIIDIKPLNKVSQITVKTSNKTYTVISNSTQIEVEDYVIFAPIGSTIFKDNTVSAREIEGVKTEGLLLALENLGIETKSADIALLGKDFEYAQELFNAFCRLDAIYTLDVPGNRPDWLSVRELARALSIHFDLELKEYNYNYSPQGSCALPISIKSDRCVRYSLSHIQGIQQKQTSGIVQKRLYLLGMRPINFLVDLSNMTMLELGQPNHIFDASSIQGSIIIRQAQEGENFTLLDGTETTLSSEDLVIADDSKILALAGIMGGLNSGVTDNTKDIYIESASFEGVYIRRTAKRLGIKTESSLRFEKNISTELVPHAQFYIAEYLNSFTSFQNISDLSDSYPKANPSISFHINPEEIRSYLGANDISDDFIQKVITKIGCTCDHSQKTWIVQPNGIRSDIRIKEDIIEEVARFYGYNNIPSRTYRPSQVTLNPEKSLDEKIRPILRGMGLSEAITIAFRSKEQQTFYKLDHEDSVSILNPLNSEWTEMRTHVFDGLLEALKLNTSKGFASEVALSEIASTFCRSKDSNNPFIEKKVLSFLVSNEKNPYQQGLNILNNILIYTKSPAMIAQNISSEKQPFLHPLNSFNIIINDQVVGFFGEIHPELFSAMDLSDKKDIPSPVICELFFDKLIEFDSQVKSMQKISEFPPVFRDITLSIKEDMLAINIVDLLKQKNSLIKDVQFLSVFQNEILKIAHKKNISLRIRFESENSINAQEIDVFIKELLEQEL